MFIRKIDQIDATRNLKTALMPILWVDEVSLFTKENVDFKSK